MLVTVRVSIANMSALSYAADTAFVPVAAKQPKLADSGQVTALAQRALAGESGAVDTLLGEIRPKVVRYCRGRLWRHDGRYDVADDVAQEVCMAVLSALPNYRDMGRPFMAFVYGIAAHKVADAKRSGMRIDVPIRDIPDSAEEAPGPEECALRLSDAQEARKLLEMLPEQQRELILLRVGAGLSAEETAKALGMTAGAVRVQQHRSLAKLRALAGQAAPH